MAEAGLAGGWGSASRRLLLHVLTPGWDTVEGSIICNRLLKLENLLVALSMV